jgi:hypothetical protein
MGLSRIDRSKLPVFPPPPLPLPYFQNFRFVKVARKHPHLDTQTILLLPKEALQNEREITIQVVRFSIEELPAFRFHRAQQKQYEVSPAEIFVD